jgi:hypothetical protein
MTTKENTVLGLQNLKILTNSLKVMLMDRLFVKVIIRVRPLNSMEKGTNGYNRCLKQESSQTITWIGQPENRFTFDHVACETVDQV